VFKFLFYILLFFSINQCSLDTKTGFWTNDLIKKENKDKLEEIFKSKEVLNKEFNPNLKIKINSVYKKNPFMNNYTNNSGYINYESNFKGISKFKFKKIKNFNFFNPDLLIGEDNSLTFFDNNGSIYKFDENSKLIWKKNHYNKREIKQKPLVYFAREKNTLIAADNIANLYAMDFINGNLMWKNFNSASFNSEIKIYEGKIFLIDFENVIKCISIKTGKEIWKFETQKSFIKSQRKLSLIIQNGTVIYMDTFGDINALNANTGNLIWQSQTINEDIFESAFLLKYSKLVYDKETIYVSNNQNKFFALDSASGQLKWEQSINSYLDPVIIENLIFTISNEGYFILLDTTTGNILRSTYILNSKKNKNIYPTGFIVAKNFIYVSLSNGRLLKIRTEDGKLKNIIKIDGDQISKPFVSNNKMYVLRNDAIIKVE